MTSTVTKLTARAIDAGSQHGVELVAVVLLIVLLVLYQIVRSLGDPRAARSSRVYLIAIAPLLLVFGAVVVRNLVDVLSSS